MRLILVPMSVANIKIPSTTIETLKRYTGEATGQKAAESAIVYYLRDARQRRIAHVLGRVSFRKGFDPLRLRQYER